MARSDFLPAPQKSVLPFAYPSVDDTPIVLCVDDDPAILELLEDVLTACGLRTLCTDDANLALKLLSEPIDVVVLDYNMPQIDGLTLAGKLRGIKADLPVIFFSGGPLPLETMAIASRVVHKGDGVLPLTNAIFESIPRPK